MVLGLGGWGCRVGVPTTTFTPATLPPSGADPEWAFLSQILTQVEGPCQLADANVGLFVVPTCAFPRPSLAVCPRLLSTCCVPGLFQEQTDSCPRVYPHVLRAK